MRPDIRGTEGLVTESSLNRLNLAVTMVLAVVTGVSGFFLSRADERLKTVEANVKGSEEKRADRESVEKRGITVYEAVVKSLETDNSKRQRVAKALVTSMLDDPLRAELLAVLSESGTAEVRTEAQSTLTKENTFKADEDKTIVRRPEKPFDWENFDYDIFWCERSGTGARDIASKIVAQLKKEGAKGRLRVRLLPDSINARPGYQHSSYVIRYNTGEETQAAELARVGDTVLGKQGNFQQSLSYQNTPWYLSAFVCATTQ